MQALPGPPTVTVTAAETRRRVWHALTSGNPAYETAMTNEHTPIIEAPDPRDGVALSERVGRWPV